MNDIKLTKTVAKGGCAAKVAAVVLREMLQGVKFPPAHRELLVDAGTFDDAAVYQVNDEIALVQTLDFFTPIVNDPYSFGQVAAANAMSDVYAMGGVPKTCLAILAYPVAAFPTEIGAKVLQGAADKIAEAGATLVGGHSIDDDTMKFGLSVTGFVHPQSIWTNAGAKPGDVLILTKPLGTGTLVAGLKADTYSESEIDDALRSMTTLNRVVELLPEAAVAAIHAATDVTGFGLAGHAMQAAAASNASFVIRTAEVPRFAKAIESLERRHLTKAHVSNKSYTEGTCSFSELSETERLLLFDPQTSGGLLLAVEQSAAQEIVDRLRDHFSAANIVGEVTTPSTAQVTFN